MRNLSLLLITHLVDTLLIAFLPARFQYLTRALAIFVSVTTLVLAWGLRGSFDILSNSMQFSEELIWKPRM